MAQFSIIRRSRVDLDEVKLVSKQVSPMRLVLTVADSRQVISVPLSGRLVIGRGGNSQELEIDLSSLDGIKYGLSRAHAVFTYDNNSLFIEDLKSTNGTRINGYPLDAGKPYSLHNGDELELGSLRLVVRVVRPRG